MFGRMEAYKGLGVLIDAMDLLAERGVRPTLVVAGNGPDLTELRPRLEGMTNVIVRDGWISRADAIEEFQKASFVIAPYLEATQSGVVATAFANGRAVVASRTGGLADVLTDELNGLLVPPGDPVALAGAIERLLGDDDLGRRLARGAEASTAGELSWDRAAATLARAYFVDFSSIFPSTGPALGKPV